MTLAPSSYQQAILDFATGGEGGAVVQAVAGSGKTSTLRMAAGAVFGQVQVVTFSAATAEELGRRMPPNARCGTLHSGGKRAWTQGRKVQMDGDKTKRIVRYHQDKTRLVPRWLPGRKIAKIVSLAKGEGLVPEGTANMVGLVPDTAESWTALFDHYGVETDDRLTPELLVGAARHVLRTSIEYGSKIIDFDDMLYLPTLTEGVVFPRSKWVFVDELQDLSGLQREQVLRMASRGRLLGVGDRNQAIYGWRGADVRSMDTIRERASAAEMPLSICYRCPRKVVELARELVPQIEAAPGAEEGLVEDRDTFRLSEFHPGHMVLCRNRAPMVAMAYKLLGHGLPVRVLGRNVGQGIVGFMEGLGQTLVEDMLEALSSWVARALARAAKRDDEEAAEEALDQEATIRAIAEGLPRVERVDELCRHVEGLFGLPEAGKVLVGTIHAAKGLEADEVWFLDPELIPSRGARQDWQRVQEKNLRYVALTRARRVLRFVRSRWLV